MNDANGNVPVIPLWDLYLVPLQGDIHDSQAASLSETVLARIARGARIVVCGAISQYNEEDDFAGLRNYYRIVAQRGRIQGFVVLDFLGRAGEAVERLAQWVAEGRIAWEVDVQQGFENVPPTPLRLYSGANFGKQLLEL